MTDIIKRPSTAYDRRYAYRFNYARKDHNRFWRWNISNFENTGILVTFRLTRDIWVKQYAKIHSGKYRMGINVRYHERNSSFFITKTYIERKRGKSILHIIKARLKRPHFDTTAFYGDDNYLQFRPVSVIRTEKGIWADWHIHNFSQVCLIGRNERSGDYNGSQEPSSFRISKKMTKIIGLWYEKHSIGRDFRSPIISLSVVRERSKTNGCFNKVQMFGSYHYIKSNEDGFRITNALRTGSYISPVRCDYESTKYNMSPADKVSNKFKTRLSC